MNVTDAASALSALGHEARLEIFRLLVRAEPDGLNIGEIGRLLGAPPSTLAHHLGALVRAGLVSQEKVGREVINHARTEAMRRVFAYVEEECCRGVSKARGDAA